MSWIRVILSVFAVSFATAALAQQPLYGPPISADEAKKVAAAGLAEARKNNFNMAVAVVDSTGHLVYFERMDTVQLGSIAIAQDKVPDIPFIFVTGSLGEEMAIQALKNGATDFVLKHRLSMLPSAVHRALRQAFPGTAGAAARSS